MKVTKFGGSSLANPEQIRKVKAIVESDSDRQVVVVSAPGKDDYIKQKVTDLLLAIAGENTKISYLNAVTMLQDRFMQICRAFNLSDLEKSILSEIDLLSEEPRDFIASRGEYWNAQIMAQVLGLPFFDAKNFISLKENNKPQLDLNKTASLLQELKGKRFVFPGFYGDFKGQIATFSRGGSDLTGSILAFALNAELYENWTDVNGLYYASPKIVTNPKTIPSLTYKELRELTYMGFEAFHDEAMFPLIKGRIPVRIKNTNNPDSPGTLISEHPGASETSISGIAAKPGFAYVEIEKYLMNSEKGFGMRVLKVFSDLGLSYEHAPSGIDNIAVILDGNNGFADKKEELTRRLTNELNPDYIGFQDNLALIAVVGRGMRSTPGIMSRISTTLAKNRINIELINQGPSETNVVLGIAEEDYQQGVRAIYDEFVLNTKGEDRK
jgi:aspartate kinase